MRLMVFRTAVLLSGLLIIGCAKVNNTQVVLDSLKNVESYINSESFDTNEAQNRLSLTKEALTKAEKELNEKGLMKPIEERMSNISNRIELEKKQQEQRQKMAEVEKARSEADEKDRIAQEMKINEDEENKVESEYDFRLVKWGMTIDEVKKVEKAKLSLDEPDQLIYESKNFGFKSLIAYNFKNGKLTDAIRLYYDIIDGIPIAFDLFASSMFESLKKDISKKYNNQGMENKKDEVQENIWMNKNNRITLRLSDRSTIPYKNAYDQCFTNRGSPLLIKNGDVSYILARTVSLSYSPQ